MKVNRRSVLEGIGFLGLGTVARGLTGAVGTLLTAPPPARAALPQRRTLSTRGNTDRP